MRRLPLFLLLLLIIGGIALYFFVLRPGGAEGETTYGPAVALCPGPDQYGYTCEGAAGYAYVDATNDTGLYQDDGVTSLDLPFPFTFYGTTYEQAWASSNGNLQFTTQNPAFENACLDGGPAGGMGAMIAPYWDDLDLRLYGFLETEVVGEAPNRVFVVEWDSVPPFGGAPEDAVTFAVHLFEGSNDVVFFYPDVTTPAGANGSGATIGIQNAAQGLALQYGCNQPVLTDAATLRFLHPAQPNPDVGEEEAVAAAATTNTPTAKGDVALLLERINRSGQAALPSLKQQWLNQPQARLATWHWADVTGDGRDDLLVLWRGAGKQPALAEAAVFAATDGGDLALLFNEGLSTREGAFARPGLVKAADVTGDGVRDVVLRDEASGRVLVLTGGATVHRHPLPERCLGATTLRDADGDGILDILRDGCSGPFAATYTWDGAGFTLTQP